MKALTLEDILAAEDIKVDSVPCPEWGGEVHVRTLTGAARDRIDAQFTNHGGDPDRLEGMRAAVVGASLCDADGTPYHLSSDELDRLAQKSGQALDRCYAKCVELSGLGGSAVDDAVGN